MQKALVTGASGAIGSAISHELRERLSVEVLELSTLQCDLRDPLGVFKFLDGIDVKDISILVLCAGINNPIPLEKVDSQLFYETININLFSQKLILDRVIPNMVSNGYGRVVAISSLYATKARVGRWSYSASKAAIETLIKSTAIEYAHHGILANCVTPGFIDTPLTRKNNSREAIKRIEERIPLGRLGTPEEIAKIAGFLLSSENTYITGQSLVADGGIGIV